MCKRKSHPYLLVLTQGAPELARLLLHVIVSVMLRGPQQELNHKLAYLGVPKEVCLDLHQQAQCLAHLLSNIGGSILRRRTYPTLSEECACAAFHERTETRRTSPDLRLRGLWQFAPHAGNKQLALSKFNLDEAQKAHDSSTRPPTISTHRASRDARKQNPQPESCSSEFMHSESCSF